MLEYEAPDADDSSMRLRILMLGSTLSVLTGLLTATPALATYFVSPIELPDTTTFYSLLGPGGDHVRLQRLHGRRYQRSELDVQPATPGAERRDGAQRERDHQPEHPTLPEDDRVRLAGGDRDLPHDLRGRGLPRRRRRARPRVHAQTATRPDHVDRAGSLLPVDQRRLQGHDGCDLPVGLHVGARDRPRLRVRHRRDLLRCARPGGRPLHADRRDPTLHLEREGRRGRPPPERGLLGRITATDPGGITRTSPAKEVSIARVYRARRTVSKNGSAYHHRSPTTVLAAGGTCGLQRLTVPKDLRIDCDDARVRVFWRWSLPASGEIEFVSFVMVDVPGACHTTKGHTGNDSFLRVGGLGANHCRVDKARITYSYLKAS